MKYLMRWVLVTTLAIAGVLALRGSGNVPQPGCPP
jgi:hypothetical protein